MLIVRTVRVLVLALVVAAAAGAGFWAGRVALQAPVDPLAMNPPPSTYVVETGMVGRSLSFAALAEWELVPLAQRSGSGVVTSVLLDAEGGVVEPGDVAFTVNLRPVVVAEGAVPMFRSMGLRAEGADVAQLQTLLIGLGFYEGETDGVFGVSTRTAVRAWQESLGVEDSGVVEAGDIAFVPSLPARVVLAESVTVGARLADGETVLLLVPDVPVFQIPLAPEQAALVPLTADVVVSFAEGTWEAQIVRAIEKPEFGQLDLILSGSDGGSVCGDDCAEWVELQGRNNFRAEVIVVPETTGPVVPVAAISTNPGNEPYVTLEDGTQVPVTIVASASGIAVVEGIDAGTVIQLPVAGS